MMQKITPNLWFDDQAEEAVNFYISLFENSKIENIVRYGAAGAQASGRAEDSVMTVAFQLAWQSFLALNGGPHFEFTPAISFLVGCNTKEEVDMLWGNLSDGGTVLMPLDNYPFSERYGWVQDRYGLSWQVMFVGDREVKQKITPMLLFVGNVCGKAEDAMHYYTSLFSDSEVTTVARYEADEDPDQEGTIKHAAFSLAGQNFMAMESAREHHFTFNEAISFIVNCENQEEVDYFWTRLSADPAAEQCGWLKDKYGVSWQIVPTVLPELLNHPDPEKTEHVMNVMLQMKKLDIAQLQGAYEQV